MRVRQGGAEGGRRRIIHLVMPLIIRGVLTMDRQLSSFSKAIWARAAHAQPCPSSPPCCRRLARLLKTSAGYHRQGKAGTQAPERTLQSPTVTVAVQSRRPSGDRKGAEQGGKAQSQIAAGGGEEQTRTVPGELSLVLCVRGWGDAGAMGSPPGFTPIKLRLCDACGEE